MKKFTFFATVVLAIFMQSCGSSKPVEKIIQLANEPRLKELKTLVVDKLVAEETDKLRAVGIATDIDEMEARKEALQNGQIEIASMLETSIVALTQVYNQKVKANSKKFTERERKEFIELTVSQKISTHAVGTPDRFITDDGEYHVYRCVELRTPTAELLGEIHDELTREEVIGVDYDRKKFIEDNLEMIQELREKAR